MGTCTKIELIEYIRRKEQEREARSHLNRPQQQPQRLPLQQRPSVQPRQQYQPPRPRPNIPSSDEVAFANRLNSIPKVQIGTNGQKMPVRSTATLYELKYANVTARSNYALLGEYVAIDLETCGLKATDPVVEVSAIHFDGYEPVSIFTTLVNPQRPIPEAASKVNKITDDMVKGAPTIWAIMPSLRSYVGGLPIVGHNLPFDLKFLYRYGLDIAPRQKLYDTLVLAQKTLKKPRDVDNHKLTSCCEFYNIKYFGAHRSAADAYVTGLLFAELVSDRTGT